MRFANIKPLSFFSTAKSTPHSTSHSTPHSTQNTQQSNVSYVKPRSKLQSTCSYITDYFKYCDNKGEAFLSFKSKSFEKKENYEDTQRILQYCGAAVGIAYAGYVVHQLEQRNEKNIAPIEHIVNCSIGGFIIGRYLFVFLPLSLAYLTGHALYNGTKNVLLKNDISKAISDYNRLYYYSYRFSENEDEKFPYDSFESYYEDWKKEKYSSKK